MTRRRSTISAMALCGFLVIMAAWALSSSLKPHLGRVPGDLLIAASLDRPRADGAQLVLEGALPPRTCGSKTPFALTARWQVDPAVTPWIQLWLLGEDGNPVLWHAGATPSGEKQTGPWIGPHTMFLLVAGNTGELIAAVRAEELPCVKG